MNTNAIKLSALSLACMIGLGACQKQNDTPAVSAAPSDSSMSSAAPTTDSIPNNPLKAAYFGEQHLHTQYSLDAFLGGEALTPDGAYKFAQGAEV